MMWFFLFPFILVPFGILMLLRHGAMGAGCCGAHGAYGPHTQVQAQDPGRPDPMQIVRERFARGEITAEEYETIRKALG